MTQSLLDLLGVSLGLSTPQNLTFDGNETVDAVFTWYGPYNLTLTTSGTGSGTIEANSSGPYYYGDTVMIWANASTGSFFAGFSGALTGTTTPQNLVINENMTVTAQFTLSDGGGGSQPPPSPENIQPVADLSAGEPYQGFVNTEITFDGSKSYDPDGNITNWFWDFGDNTSGTGEILKHIYTKAGVYTVTLTVTDDGGATHTDTTTCVITQQNRPPTAPIITGPTSGTKNTMYTYTAVSTDPDNDTIQYTFDWGDSVTAPQSSGFLPNGTSFAINHSWAAAGRYDVTVMATDNQTSSSSKITVFIDAEQIGDIGYLLDTNGDGIYDAFYSDVSNQITAVEKKDGSYYIDSDGDGEWDYTFDELKGLTPYQPPKTNGVDIVLIIGVIVVIVLCVGIVAICVEKEKK
jgi:PKD repeat protein